MRNVLVVGGTGFVGRRLVEALSAQGIHCRVAARKRPPDGTFDPSMVEFVPADVTCPDTLAGLAKDVDTAYNLSGAGHVTAMSEEAYQTFYKVNVTGTENLAHACAKYSLRRFVHFSSTAALGLIRTRAIDEHMEPEPHTPYQRSKRQGEIALLRIQAKTGLPIVILRPCMIYGPGGKGEFLKFCRLISKGLFPRAGLGDNLTPLVHVDDVVSAAMLAGERGRPGETYLVASDHSPKMAYIHKTVTRALGIWRPYWYVPVWALLTGALVAEIYARWRNQVPIVTRRNILSTVASRVFVIEKARRELGYTPQMPLERGIPSTTAWYVAQGLL
jgi:nucleoside-diphosphate-sugar epimerase